MWVVVEQFFVQGFFVVFLFKDVVFLQFRYQQFDDIVEGFVSDGIGEVKVIDVCFFDSGLQFVCYGLCVVNYQWIEVVDFCLIGQGLYCLLVVWISG